MQHNLNEMLDFLVSNYGNEFNTNSFIKKFQYLNCYATDLNKHV